jgi:hypothetical protein
MSTIFNLTITVGGTPTSYGPGSAGRASNRIKLDRFTQSIDAPQVLEFHQYGRALPPSWKEGAIVELDYLGTPLFLGEIVSIQPSKDQTGWTFGYQCKGLKYVGNKIPVTNSFDSTGLVIYNLPSDDPDYLPANSGLSVATMLTNMFTMHATALAAVGIAGFVAGDLTPLTLVPTDPVTFSGPAFFNAIDQFLDKWAGLYSCWIEWVAATSDWRIRVKNSTTFTPTTLTLGTDPIDWPNFARDSSGSYSNVVIRGKANIEPLYGSVIDGTLTPAWTSGQQTSWTWNDFIQPGGSTDYGTITALTSTTVTVKSHDTSVHWVANFWSTNKGSLWCINPASTVITQQEYRQIISCTAMVAGGTSVLTLDRPLVNGGYTNYRAVCIPVDSLGDVWRRYNVTSSVAFGHLVHKFNIPVTWGVNGAVESTLYPVAAIANGAASWPATFLVDPTNNQIVFTEPVVKVGNSQSVLNAGGGLVVAPTDVNALIAYSRGTLTASAGPSGTFHSFAGITRTWYLDDPAWINAGDQSSRDALAALRLATVQDTVINGDVSYNGLYAPALALGMALNVAGNGYTTGWEAINGPVRQIVLNWPADGASNFMTTLAVNNRRKPATGESYYIHPAFTGGAAWEQSGQGSIGLGGYGSESMGDEEWGQGGNEGGYEGGDEAGANEGQDEADGGDDAEGPGGEGGGELVGQDDEAKAASSPADDAAANSDFVDDVLDNTDPSPEPSNDE